MSIGIGVAVCAPAVWTAAVIGIVQRHGKAQLKAGLLRCVR
jgi:hypothetical protein